MDTTVIDTLNNLPIRGHRYEFIVGKVRKDGKFPLYIKDWARVQNGNIQYWSGRAQKRLLIACETNAETVTLAHACLYLLNRRAGMNHERAFELSK